MVYRLGDLSPHVKVEVVLVLRLCSPSCSASWPSCTMQGTSSAAGTITFSNTLIGRLSRTKDAEIEDTRRRTILYRGKVSRRLHPVALSFDIDACERCSCKPQSSGHVAPKQDKPRFARAKQQDIRGTAIPLTKIIDKGWVSCFVHAFVRSKSFSSKIMISFRVRKLF